MKQVLVKELKEGDVFYYNDSYRVLLQRRSYQQDGTWYFKVKCIMAPTKIEKDDIGVGTVSHIAGYIKVKLLVRYGKEV